MNIAELEILEYTEDMGHVNWPLGFEQVLSGKSMEEQVRHYMVFDEDYIPMSYYMVNWARALANKHLEPLDAYAGWEKVIVRDGLVVGFVRYGRRILPYRTVAADYTSDNNGAGYKERTDYYYLVCVPEKLEQPGNCTPPFGAPLEEPKIPVIPYDGSQGANPLPQGYEPRLAGKSLSAQMYYFAVTDYYPGRKQAWVDDWDKYAPYYFSDLLRGRRGFLPFLDNLEALIVQEGLLVGVRVRLPEGSVGQTTADLYPYVDFQYEQKHPWALSASPRFLQLFCTNLPA